MASCNCKNKQSIQYGISSIKSRYFMVAFKVWNVRDFIAFHFEKSLDLNQQFFTIFDAQIIAINDHVIYPYRHLNKIQIILASCHLASRHILNKNYVTLHPSSAYFLDINISKLFDKIIIWQRGCSLIK